MRRDAGCRGRGSRTMQTVVWFQVLFLLLVFVVRVGVLRGCTFESRDLVLQRRASRGVAGAPRRPWRGRRGGVRAVAHVRRHTWRCFCCSFRGAALTRAKGWYQRGNMRLSQSTPGAGTLAPPKSDTQLSVPRVVVRACVLCDGALGRARATPNSENLKTSARCELRRHSPAPRPA